MERIKRLFRGKMPKVNLAEKPKQTSWRIEGCEIIFPLKGINATPTSWIERFEGSGNRISTWVKSVLRHKEVTFDNKTIEFEVVFVRSSIFADSDRNGDHIGDYSKANGYLKPDLFQSCLISEGIDQKMLTEFSAEWVMLMHPPIIEDGKERLFILYPFEESKKKGVHKKCLSLHNYRSEQKHTATGLYAYIRPK